MDVDFDMMMEKYRLNPYEIKPHLGSEGMRICLIVRKRPLFQKECKAGEMDAISASNPTVRVHETKFKVDGITKYIENHDFRFDNAFSDVEDTNDIYEASL